ncbi:MAG: glycosyltransferase family 4 protein [Candidatus Omnitrophica bacterium]|nr:glycosyltransferase family 4 protein [Candidatus Omnitrophota bacterium]MCM8816049.1 glycosyltransferase family 4 protein [Candidatus Omnitrophota bacterium]
MKVFLMVPEMDLGGVEEGTFDLANGLKKIGIDVAVISGPGDYIPLLQEAGIKWFNLPTNKKTPVVFLKALRKLKEILNKEEPDIIHCRSRFPAWIAYYALSGSNKTKFITSIHGYYSCPFYSKILAKGQRVIAISDALKEFAIKKLGAKPELIRVVHNGIRFEPYINLKKEKHNEFVVGCIGRFTKLKGYQYIVKAFDIAKKVLPNIELMLVGDGPYKKKLEKLSKKLKLDVKFFKGKAYEFLPKMDLLVAPHTETETLKKNVILWLGRTVYEAQLTEVPVLTTLKGVPKGTFIKTQTELITPPCDIQAIAKAIIFAATHSDEIRTMATNGKKFVINHFSVEQMVSKTLQVYKEVVNG